MHPGKFDSAFEHPVGRGGHDVDPVLSSEKLWTQLRHQTKDGPEGKTWTSTHQWSKGFPIQDLLTHAKWTIS